MAKITQEDKQVYRKTALIVSVVLAVWFAWLWWNVVTSKQNVFNRMLDQSLQTYGVTKTVNQKFEDDTTKQFIEEKSRIQFGAQNIVEVVTTINQESPAEKINLVTRTIGTPDENYVSYDRIDVVRGGKKVDFSSLLNKWAVQKKEERGEAVFAESLYGIVLFGNLSGQQKDELRLLMRDKQIYNVDFNKVEQMTINGRMQYQYKVEIAAKSYIELLKKYDTLLGTKYFEQLNPDDYGESAKFKVTMYVDKNSQTLTRITYQDNNLEENFSAYGLRKNVEIPQQTILRQQLEEQLNAVLQNIQ